MITILTIAVTILATIGALIVFLNNIELSDYDSHDKN
jgi:hypothetical protein